MYISRGLFIKRVSDCGSFDQSKLGIDKKIAPQRIVKRVDNLKIAVAYPTLVWENAVKAAHWAMAPKRPKSKKES